MGPTATLSVSVLAPEHPSLVAAVVLLARVAVGEELQVDRSCNVNCEYFVLPQICEIKCEKIVY